jgi:hypothetical protein
MLHEEHVIPLKSNKKNVSFVLFSFLWQHYKHYNLMFCWKKPTLYYIHILPVKHIRQISIIFATRKCFICVAHEREIINLLAYHN